MSRERRLVQKSRLRRIEEDAEIDQINIEAKKRAPRVSLKDLNPKSLEYFFLKKAGELPAVSIPRRPMVEYIRTGRIKFPAYSD